MNLKVALLLLVVLFAATAVTTSVMFNVRLPTLLGQPRNSALATFVDVHLMGDPVDGDLPH